MLEAGLNARSKLLALLCLFIYFAVMYVIASFIHIWERECY